MFSRLIQQTTTSVALAAALAGLASQAQAIPAPVQNGLQMHLRADAGVLNAGATAATDGQAVATWSDQAAAASQGGVNNATAVAGQQPAFIANGIQVSPGVFLPVLRFVNPGVAAGTSSTSDFDQMTTNLPMSNQFTIYAVVKVTDTRPRAIVGTTSITSLPADTFNFFRETNDLIYRTNGVTDSRTAAPVNQFFLGTARGGTVNGQVTTQVIGAGSATGNTHDTTYNANTLTVGGPISGTSGRALDGDFAELLIFNRELSLAGRTAVETYLNQKYFAPPTKPVVTFFSDFDGINDNTGTLVGNAAIANQRLELTQAANNQQGTFYVPDLAVGGKLTSFNASFSLKMGPGSSDPADGVTFNFGRFANNSSTIDDTIPLTEGLRIFFDSEDALGSSVNAPPNDEGINVFYNGVELAGGRIIKELTTDIFEDVFISVSEAGLLTVMHGNSSSSVLLPNWNPQSGWQFALGSRTGGRNAEQYVDDLSITGFVQIPEPATATMALFGLAGLAMRRRRMA